MSLLGHLVERDLDRIFSSKPIGDGIDYARTWRTHLGWSLGYGPPGPRPERLDPPAVEVRLYQFDMEPETSIAWKVIHLGVGEDPPGVYTVSAGTPVRSVHVRKGSRIVGRVLEVYDDGTARVEPTGNAIP